MKNKKTLRTAQNVYDSHGPDPAEIGGRQYLYPARADAAQTRDAIFAHMQELVQAPKDENRAMTASEERAYDWAENELDALSAYIKGLDNTIEHFDKQSRGLVGPADAPTARYRLDAPLAEGQTAQGWAHAMGERTPHQVEDSLAEHGRDLSLGRYLKGAFTGDWKDAEPEQLLNAMSGANSAAGGILLPTVLTTRIIDAARARTRVLQAGAQTVVMANRKVDVPRWLTDPVPAWRGENQPITESDATMDKITLTAKTLATVVKASREIIEDTDIRDELENAFARQFALAIDKAALYADGTNEAPVGVKATAGVAKTPMATNGASPTWDALVDSVGRLRDANEEPTGQIMADRTQRALAKLKESGTGAYLQPPAYLNDVARYSTNQVPLNLPTGTANDTSDVFTADWTQLLVGVRTQLQITVLQERYMVDNGQYGFVAWWRGDIAVARPKAFDVVTGVKG